MKTKLIQDVNKQYEEVKDCDSLEREERVEVMQLLDLKIDAINICSHNGKCDNKVCLSRNMILYIDGKIKRIIANARRNEMCSLCNKKIELSGI